MDNSEQNTLYAIKLKTELARRLITSDTEAASRERRDVENLVASAIRKTGHDSSRPLPPLATEVENAKQLLEAAEIAVHVTYEENSQPKMAELLRVVLRETVAHALHQPAVTTVRILVVDSGISISNEGQKTEFIPNLENLDVLQRVVEIKGGELTTVRNQGILLIACSFSALTHDNRHSAQPTRPT